ncbi:MAG: oligopeptide transporter, OPT family [Gammaproteobacteria bacterium RIFCSPHIGHO2_12_FULL_42_13]|nr:MAG: oligopeptide transporter, OPT family [Gammaproteobacteria bacterium RIFCSPHIGHO2_12_FULL_42_13]
MSTIHNRHHADPLIPARTRLPEFTFKVIVFSILLAAIMSAANAYLALKVGQTISASIPASVLAIGILRFFKNSNVLESNLIQTSASAGEGVAAAIAFVLPAMIFIHAWNGFDYWQTAAITAIGGLLGVFFSIPLRRVMLNMRSLRFPEGTAVGNVLCITSQSRGGTHIKQLLQGIIVGGLLEFSQTGIQVFSSTVDYWFRAGKSVFGISLGFSPAVFAAGYIVGIEVGISLFVGFVLGWVMILPWLAAQYGLPNADTILDSVMEIWTSQLRFVGVGVMLVGGIWTLIRLIKPVIDGVKVSFVSFSKAGGRGSLPRTERDIPIVWAFLGVLLCILFSYWFISHTVFANNLHAVFSEAYLLGAMFFTAIYILIVGFFLATICAYFTGLVGSSNNPLSGILILSVLLLGLVYFFVFPSGQHDLGKGNIAALMVMVIATIATCASISNENLQDLKAGQMVGATPWKQQVILGLGVVVSAFVIGPVLDLLYQAYGMGGVFPHPNMDPTEMLAAPQAGLIASVITGIRAEQMPWKMIIIGAVISLFIIAIDEIVRRRGHRMPVLAVGLGIYLPPSVILTTVVGGVVKYLVTRTERRAITDADLVVAEERQQSGILMACGLVAGAALMGVALAVPFALMGTADGLALMSHRHPAITVPLGLLSFGAMAVWVYKSSRFKKGK